MGADPAVLAFANIATALELSQETQRQLLDLNRLLRERVEALEETVAELGMQHVAADVENRSRLELLETDLARLEDRVTDVHSNALKALNARYPGETPA